MIKDVGVDEFDCFLHYEITTRFVLISLFSILQQPEKFRYANYVTNAGVNLSIKMERNN